MPYHCASLVPVSTPAFLTVAQAADLLHVHRRTIRRWIEEGRLDALRTSRKKGRLLIPRAALDDFLTGARAFVREGGKRGS